MVRRGAICLLLVFVAAGAWADERKCRVRQADGSLEIRYIALTEAARATTPRAATNDASPQQAERVLARVLAREAPQRWQRVEQCIPVSRPFATSEARAVEAATPR
ncbi:hypothetical protein [Salinicola avicenniae]|uniref:hypothetical protein n=1 Tax=Salinicola avicenniae TaxID=2916836 RepID=UPI002072D957|nr:MULTISPECIES: hypothetical protein [unclassified Salinicola]